MTRIENRPGMPHHGGVGDRDDKVFTLAELSAMPVISTVELDDLRFQSEERRVWLSRRALDQGAEFLNQVTEEAREGDAWVTVERYPACTELTDCSCPKCDTF